jgi:hypothetical protein
LTKVTSAAIDERNHDYSFAGVCPDAASVVTYDSARLDFPFAAVKMHVCTAYASSLELHNNFSARNLRLRKVFDFDVVWTVINCCFQKQNTF